jgi:hypothetical protein
LIEGRIIIARILVKQKGRDSGEVSEGGVRERVMTRADGAKRREC